MKIVHDDLYKKRILEQIQTREFKQRDSIHFSSLNYCLRKHWFSLKYPDLAKSMSEQTILKFSVGLALERWITGDYEQKEVEIDGIIMTPDFINPNDQSELLEIKSTYMSSNKDVKEQGAWIRQMQAYCKAYSVLVFRLPVIHLVGNWKPVWTCDKPTMNVWRFDFTQEEIDANWEDALYKKKLLEDAIRDDEMPEPLREKWECKFCIWGQQMMCSPDTRD